MKKHAVFRSVVDPILLFGIPFKYLMVVLGLTVLLIISPIWWAAPAFISVAVGYAAAQQRNDPRWMMIIARRLKLRLPAFKSGKRSYVA